MLLDLSFGRIGAPLEAAVHRAAPYQ